MKTTQPYSGLAYPPWWQVTETYEFRGKPVVRAQL